MNPSAYNDRSTFIRRLAYFLIGTAIGLFILGIVKEQKKRAAQNSPNAMQWQMAPVPNVNSPTPVNGSPPSPAATPATK